MATELSCERRHTVSETKQVKASYHRSVPHRKPFVTTVFLCALHYMGILAAITTLVIYFLEPSQLATKVLIACLGFIAFTWLLAFFKRRSTHCPLCKGTPLINTGALPHKKAFRIFPFNHGVSATLSIIATHKFRCMYCGTGFDILKQPTHLRENNRKAQEDSYTPYNTYTPDDKG